MTWDWRRRASDVEYDRRYVANRAGTSASETVSGSGAGRFSAASLVMVTAKFGSAEDTPSNRCTDGEGHYRIAEESFLRRDLLKPGQRRCCARRAFTHAHHFSRNDTHLASAWIDEFRAPPGVRHQQVAGVCFHPAGRLLKSVTAVDQHNTLDRVHGGGESRHTQKNELTKGAPRGNFWASGMSTWSASIPRWRA